MSDSVTQPPAKLDLTQYSDDPELNATAELLAQAIDRLNEARVATPRRRENVDPAELHQRAQVLRVLDEMDRERARREARRRLDAEERGPQPEPEILTLREHLARPRTATAYRIDGYQPIGTRVMLAAQFKSGKTTLVGCTIRSLVDADPFLGGHRVDPVSGTVALIDTEMSPSQLVPWLEDQGIQNDDRVVVVPLRGAVATFDVTDPDTRARWAVWLRARDVSYLVVDCLRPILDAHGLDEHRDAGRFLVGLDALMAEAGIPEGLVVQHMGHTAERSRGDSRLRDWPDVEWRLVRQDENPASPRYLTAYGRDVDMPERQLAYDPATRRLTAAGGSRQDAKVDGALDAVLDVLGASSEPLSVRRIISSLADSDHADHAVRAAIRRGRETGRIATEPGQRGAILHRLAVRPIAETSAIPDDRVERVEPCQQRVSHGESECVSVSIERHAHTHDALDEVRPVQLTRSDPWANLPPLPGRDEAIIATADTRPRRRK